MPDSQYIDSALEYRTKNWLLEEFMKLISVRSSLERISSIICIFCEKKHIKSEQMLVQTNLQRLADDNYNSYYDPYNVYDNSYSYTMDYIIYGSIAGAIIFGAALFFYFMIKRRRNRLRRAQLTNVFMATNRFQPGTGAQQQTPHMVAGQGLPPPAYAYYPPQGQPVYGNFAQPGVMTAAGGYQYQPSNQQGTSGPVQHTPY